MRLHLLQKVLRLPQAALKRAVTGLLQLVLLVNRPARLARSGFVLPTTVLLVLMVVLTVTALTYRSFTRSDMAISQREQQVISNAATPAIDRAKAKIEFLFRSDPRFPAGVPASDILSDLMATKRDANDYVGYTGRVSPLGSGPSLDPSSPYTLPDETRVDINNDTFLDNAWSFNTDVNGDGTVGTDELVVYSILVDDQGPETATTHKVEDIVSQAKANALVTRTGALATTEASPACAGALAESGWQLVTQGNNSSLQKNFQVNAFVANANAANRTFETLEFQQSRIASRASRWGAWFRYDLGVFPGAPFNWNGAVHTDGSFFANQGNFRAHMISSQNSCLYTKEASTITVGEVDLDGDDIGTPGKSVTVNGQAQEEFQGQIVRGSLVNNVYAEANTTEPEIHYWDGAGVKPVMGATLTATGAANRTHSVVNGKPFDIAMNPLRLFTNDVTEHIKPSAWTRNGNWNNVLFKSNDRTKNEIVTRPFVDDFYRADNRWGPKPRYDSKDPSLDVTSPENAATIGDPITSATVVSKLTNSDDGLDGYWERQAIKLGLRLIVGQRLELGNAAGWGLTPSVNSTTLDPANEALYPAVQRPTAADKFGRKHEYLQRRSLRDNLAAVQGMVVYHYEKDSGKFPAACMAMTAHPGTQASIVQSRTFTDWLSGGVKTSFLTGRGTNGWEFGYNPKFATEDDFKTAYDLNLNSSPLKKALSNLAYFAGDPLGGAPSFPPEQDSVVHPYPYLSMWGDFSVLRRILASPTPYDKLSPADQSTLHSAACTLGLLAYNLNKQKADFDDGITDEEWGEIAISLLALVENGTIAVATVETANWLQAAAANAAANENIQEIQAASEYFQIQRDRTFGFLSGQGLEAVATPTLAGIYDQAAASFTFAGAPPTPYTATSYRVGCDPNLFVDKGVKTVSGALTLALALCPKTEPTVRALSVKYPSLHYLFPRADHDQYQTPTPLAGITGPTTQPPSEEYIDATYPVAATPGNIPNYPVINTYQVIGDTPDDLTALAAQPRLPGAATDEGWVLPYTTSSTGSVADTNRPFSITNPAGGILNVTFLDKGIFDGREQLNTRVLDVDIEALTTRRYRTGDFWLPSDKEKKAEGVVYAFREDAVREDEIVRPKNATNTITADYCSAIASDRFRIESEVDCRMRFNGLALAQDPPLTADLISLKPVDFVGDPQRRTHGFRLRTASGKPADFSGTSYGRTVGMTFVTDNSVYIQGDFNPHSKDGSVAAAQLLEEFTQTLNDKTIAVAFDAAGANFYTNRTTLNLAEFANLAVDHWRPVEILADSLTILSSSFKDGAVIDTFTKAEPGSGGGADSSYMNQNRPRTGFPALANLIRENPADANSPVWIDRNGTYYILSGTNKPFYDVYTANSDWMRFTDSDSDRRRNTQAAAAKTYINALFVGGIVPQRAAQTYGGLHNYPRLLEEWFGKDLFIAGAFIQLNFSTAATGPFEHDAWEENGTTAVYPDGSEQRIGYYNAPNRRWGYDVGLLYVPPAPAARRFVSIGAPRSEYYRELAADDPYIVNLRCAQKADGSLVMPNFCPS